MGVDKEWVDYLSKRMYDSVMSRIPDVTLNGAADKRYPGNLNFSFAYVEVRACVCWCCCWWYCCWLLLLLVWCGRKWRGWCWMAPSSLCMH